VLLVLVIRALPLMTGASTLYLRDVLGTHLEMKAAQAGAMRRGTLPLIDPYRAGGQPALGNPDSVPLYPDNLLYLAAPTLWALNAHFWIHLLLAPLSMYWLARAWGLRLYLDGASLLFGTQHGIEGWTVPLPDQRVHALLRTREGLWVATEGGLALVGDTRP